MAQMSAKAPVLVLGIGNILLRDEGLGVHAIKAMERIKLPDFVELLDGGTAGADLIDAISNRQKLIVIDALDADVPPGTIMCIKPEDLPAGASAGISLHEFGIAETLMMARQLNCCPSQVTIIAVRPQTVDCGMELSPEMKLLMPQIIQIVLDEILTPAQQ